MMTWLARAVFGRLPLVGGLVNASKQSHKEALKELGFVWTLSLLPLLVTMIVEALVTASRTATDPNWALAFHHNVKAGEIFIYVNALSAPIWFVIYKHMRDKAPLHNQIALLWVLLITTLLSIVIFVLQRVDAIQHVPVVDKVALGILAVAFLMRYTAIVYDGLRIDFVKSQRAEERSLTETVQTFGN